jgi:hypothetical protein
MELPVRQHREVQLNCDLPVANSSGVKLRSSSLLWFHDGRPIDAFVLDTSSRAGSGLGHRYMSDFLTGQLRIANARLEDEGVWHCEDRDPMTGVVISTGRPIRLVVLGKCRYLRFGGPYCLHLQGEMIGTWIEIRVVVFWIMTPCSDVVGYQRFGGLHCLHLQGELIGVWIEIQVLVFCVMTVCSDVGYQRFGGLQCFHLQGEASGAWIDIHVVVFWVMLPCCIVVGHQRFGGPHCLHLQGEVTTYRNTIH